MPKLKFQVRRGTAIINIARLPKRWQPDKDKESTRAYIAGFMQEARKHPLKYQKEGAKRIKFVFGKVKEFRKI